MKTKSIVAGLAGLVLSAPVLAATRTTDTPIVYALESYEPSVVGLTSDSDDVKFMEIRLSVKYPMFPEIIGSRFPDWGAYFAFSGRWGQYISTRDSSPVVGKRFNPKLLLRNTFSYIGARDSEYVDYAFAHESNGQAIATKEEYGRLVEEARIAGRRTDFINDELSRGWDYLEVSWKKILGPRDEATLENQITTAYLQLKYFLPRGPLQGRAEEYNEWEGSPEGKRRRAVNGIGGILSHEWRHVYTKWIKSPRVAAVYETGYSPAFRHHTLRLESGARIVELPMTIWAQRGYGSDLTQYYKKVSSWGIEIEIGSY